MDSIWSNNVLKLNTESLLQIFCGIKNIIANHMKQRRINQATTQIISLGKFAAQNPTIFYCIFSMDHETMTYKIFSQNPSSTQLIVSHCHAKTDQYLANLLPLDSLPCLHNSWWMKSLKNMNFGLPWLRKYHGHSNGFLVAWVQPNNPTTNSQLPFHLHLNWVSTKSNMHATNNSKSSVACEITDCELTNI